jgi:hypothetical protein
MNRTRRMIATMMLVAMLLCSAFSTGCSPLNWFGSNFTLTIYIPLGLDGTPGIFNPFGIFQALANQATDPATGTGATAAADQSPNVAALGATPINVGSPPATN